jgi:hypothetical protein
LKVLWIGTGPLLELTVLELRARSRGTYDRLSGLVVTLKHPPRVLTFLDRLSGFGELRYSTGTLVELDRLARTSLPKDRPKDAPMAEFWQAFDSAIPKRLPRPLRARPLEHAALAPGDVARLGPVDAHLLAAVRESTASHLVTLDRPLMGIAAERTQGRAFFPI